MSKKSSVINSPFQNGAEWARVDFHLHTNADKEFKFTGDSDQTIRAANEG
jgi:hypothetical protein